MPRASKAPGKATASAPYSADQAALLRCVTSQAMAVHNNPAAACAATTRQGETCGRFTLRPALLRETVS